MPFVRFERGSQEAIPIVKIDASEIAHLGNMIGAAGNAAPVALARALNVVGRKTTVQMRRALAKQMGLPYGLFVRALKTQSAFRGRLEFRIRVRGGNIRLKFFKARETRKGVVAKPRGETVVKAHAFMKGGKFPNRVPLGWGGEVVERVGPGRGPLRTVKSDLFIPREFVEGASKAAFETVTTRELSVELTKALAKILAGITAADHGRFERGSSTVRIPGFE